MNNEKSRVIIFGIEDVGCLMCDMRYGCLVLSRPKVEVSGELLLADRSMLFI